MLYFITGGSGSGKSEYAEDIAQALQEGELIYIATMYPFDAECTKKIKKHQFMRREKHFRTMECFVALEKLEIPKGATVLLECLSNLLANEMYREDKASDTAVDKIIEGLEQLLAKAAHVIVVSNEVFSAGDIAEEETKRYLENLAYLHRWLAEKADKVAEIVYSIPILHKDEEEEKWKHFE